MCPKDVTDIRMPSRDDDNRLVGPPIVELEFEKDVLGPLKKERPTLCERCLQIGHPKMYCRSNRELCTNCAEHLQEGRMYDCRGNFCLYCKNTHDKKIFDEYKMEATIQSKMRLVKGDVYTAKEILGYLGEKIL